MISTQKTLSYHIVISHRSTAQCCNSVSQAILRHRVAYSVSEARLRHRVAYSVSEARLRYSVAIYIVESILTNMLTTQAVLTQFLSASTKPQIPANFGAVSVCGQKQQQAHRGCLLRFLSAAETAANTGGAWFLSADSNCSKQPLCLLQLLSADRNRSKHPLSAGCSYCLRTAIAASSPQHLCACWSFCPRTATAASSPYVLAAVSVRRQKLHQAPQFAGVCSFVPADRNCASTA